MLLFQAFYIGKCKAGEATKHKSISHLDKPFNINLLVNYRPDFMIFKKIPVYFFQFEFDISERIFCDIAVCEYYADNLSEIL